MHLKWWQTDCDNGVTCKRTNGQQTCHPVLSRLRLLNQIQQWPQSITMLKFLSTGKHSEEQDKISANSKQLSQDKHWITSKTTEDPRDPDKV
jgi:hypothetical protein